ncbi:M61 metallopeptidase family protein [Haloarcula salina]|uniref:hypothetical protein n=1 Tax=Haloarcula salina TaxID=1429914 RepID=UPI001F507395|nr:hypothetical protein [Haloarcula salina]
MNRRPLTALCCLFLIVSATAGTAHGAPADQFARPDAAGTIDARYTVDRLPDRPDLVRVTARIDRPRQVTTLSVRPPSAATVERATGLDPDGGRWRVTRETETARLVYTVPIGLTTTFGRRTADTADWTLLARQEVSLRARWRWHIGPRPTWNETLALAPGQDGVAGETAAYIGPHETATRTVGGDRITLVVPESADLRPGRAAVLDTVSRAKRASRAGPDHDHVRVFAAPNALASGGYTPSNGGPDVIVNAGEPVRSPVNVWVHEYRHTRQTFATTTEMDWLDEGSAEYHTAALTYRQGAIDAERFRKRVTSDRHSSADLTRPEAWDSPAVPYDKGTRVVAAVDARVRLATDGDRTFEDVLVRLVQRDERVSLDTFAETVSAVAGEDLDSFVRQAVTGPAPSVRVDALTASTRRGSADTAPRATKAAPVASATSAMGTANSNEDARRFGPTPSEGRAVSPGGWIALGLLVVTTLAGRRL